MQILMKSYFYKLYLITYMWLAWGRIQPLRYDLIMEWCQKLRMQFVHIKIFWLSDLCINACTYKKNWLLCCCETWLQFYSFLCQPLCRSARASTTQIVGYPLCQNSCSTCGPERNFCKSDLASCGTFRLRGDEHPEHHTFKLQNLVDLSPSLISACKC